MPHVMISGVSIGKRHNMLLMTLPYDKILANMGTITRSGFLVTSITCIEGIRAFLHVKMTMSLMKKTTSRSMHNICK